MVLITNEPVTCKVDKAFGRLVHYAPIMGRPSSGRKIRVAIFQDRQRI